MPEIDRANSVEATTIPPEKHEKRQKSTRLDFLGAKGVIHLSSDYRIIDGDQAPINNKEGLPACSELAEPTLKSAKPTPTSFKSARSTFQSARPTASTACPESARLPSQSVKPTAPASAQVGLANFELAKPTFSVSAAANASSDDSTPLVDWLLEKKSNIIQIKDMHFSNMINKVEDTNILLKFQSGRTISISASIRDILTTPSIPNYKTFDFFDIKFDHSSYSKKLCKISIFYRSLVY
jgi:hypothetical protein